MLEYLKRIKQDIEQRTKNSALDTGYDAGVVYCGIEILRITDYASRQEFHKAIRKDFICRKKIVLSA